MALSPPGRDHKFTELQPLPAAAGVAEIAARAAVFLEVSLVVFLGAPEGGRRLDHGCDGTPERTGGLESLLGLDGLLLLLGRVEEDHRAVLVADVGALAVDLGRVVHLPEGLEQGLVGDSGRVVLHLHHLGVTGAV